MFALPKLWLWAALVGTLAVSHYFAYDYGKTKPQLQQATQALALQQELAQQVHTLNTQLTQLAQTSVQQQQALAVDTQKILKRVQQQPVTVIKNGECYPSPSFLEGINSAILRSNGR